MFPAPFSFPLGHSLVSITMTLLRPHVTPCAVCSQMAVLACMRQNSIRPFTPHSSVTVPAGEAVGRSLANTATLFLLEISVVFQTIVVPLSW